MLFVFLDSGNLSPYEFDPQIIFLPQMNNLWSDFLRDYSKYHGVKKSKHFDLERQKIDSKKELLKLKMKSKPDKKATRNKSKSKTFPLDQQIGSPR